MKANTALGQHFMIDEVLLASIVRSAGDLHEKVVLEVGAGPGKLTRHLVKAHPKQIICVEIDERFERQPNVTWMYGNILELIDTINYDTVISNLPYHICEPLFIKFLAKRPVPQQIMVVVGVNFARSLQEQTILGMVLRESYFVELLEHIPPSAFAPQPRTQSALIRLTAKQDQDPDLFLQRFYYAQKTKLKNYLIKITKDTRTKNEAKALLEGLPAALLEKRLYELSTDEFLWTYNFIKHHAFIRPDATDR